jgi:hypothetical protein
MANEFLSELGRRAPQIALMFLAANRGGPQALAAFQGGMAQAQQRQEALARQAQLDEERRSLQASQEARAQSAETRAQDAATRAEEAARINRVQSSLQYLDRYAQQQGETAPDAAAAENALLGRATALEGSYGLQPGQLSPFVPNMQGPVGRGVRKDVTDMLAAAERRLAKTNPDADISDETVTYTWDAVPVRVQKWLMSQGHPEGQPVKPSHLQALSAAPTITAPKAPRAAEGFTLGEGQIRFDAKGNIIARGAPKREPVGPQSPVPVIDPQTGQPVYVRPAEALGRRPASTREQGRPVTAGDAGRIAELNTSLDDLAVLRQTVFPDANLQADVETEAPTGTRAKIGAMLPNFVTEATGWGADAKSRQAVIDRVKQVIGKALEGGVLRKEDEYKYEKILPTIGDVPAVVKAKLDGLDAAIKLRRERELDAREDAGYDVSRFRQRGAATGPQIGEQRMINGALGEWDGKQWLEVIP